MKAGRSVYPAIPYRAETSFLVAPVAVSKLEGSDSRLLAAFDTCPVGAAIALGSRTYLLMAAMRRSTSFNTHIKPLVSV